LAGLFTPVVAGSKDFDIKRLSAATRQGLSVVASVMGATGTALRTNMGVSAGKFKGTTFCHELGSGQLCAPESRLYATVKKAEEAEQMERELRAAVDHACAQQADLAAQLSQTHTSPTHCQCR